MVNDNPFVAKYNSMSIEDLEKELTKSDLVTEDRSLVIHAIARKRVSNVNSVPTPSTPVKADKLK